MGSLFLCQGQIESEIYYELLSDSVRGVQTSGNTAQSPCTVTWTQCGTVLCASGWAGTAAARLCSWLKGQSRVKSLQQCLVLLGAQGNPFSLLEKGLLSQGRSGGDAPPPCVSTGAPVSASSCSPRPVGSCHSLFQAFLEVLVAAAGEWCS